MQHIIKNIYITIKTSAGLYCESLFSTPLLKAVLVLAQRQSVSPWVAVGP